MAEFKAGFALQDALDFVCAADLLSETTMYTNTKNSMVLYMQ